MNWLSRKELRKVYECKKMWMVRTELKIMITSNQTPSKDSQAMLDSLKTAVNKTLDKKKRLGQYAVIWSGDKPVLVGEDRPEENQQA